MHSSRSLHGDSRVVGVAFSDARPRRIRPGVDTERRFSRHTDLHILVDHDSPA
jgi:hypothetical protein